MSEVQYSERVREWGRVGVMEWVSDGASGRVRKEGEGGGGRKSYFRNPVRYNKDNIDQTRKISSM